MIFLYIGNLTNFYSLTLPLAKLTVQTHSYPQISNHSPHFSSRSFNNAKDLTGLQNIRNQSIFLQITSSLTWRSPLPSKTMKPRSSIPFLYNSTVHFISSQNTLQAIILCLTNTKLLGSFRHPYPYTHRHISDSMEVLVGSDPEHIDQNSSSNSIEKEAKGSYQN